MISSRLSAFLSHRILGEAGRENSRGIKGSRLGDDLPSCQLEALETKRIVLVLLVHILGTRRKEGTWRAERRGACAGDIFCSSPEMDCREWMCRVSEGRIASGVGDQQNSWAEVGVRYPEMVHGAGASSQDRSRSRWERKVDRTMSSW